MGLLDALLRFPAHTHSEARHTMASMKTTTSILAAAAVVLGLGGAATAYQLASAPGTAVRPVSQSTADSDEVEVEVPEIEQGIEFQWAPCKPPAVLRGQQCVTNEVHTVVLSTPSSGGSNPGDNSGGGGNGDDDTHGDDDSQDDDDSYEDDDDGDDDDHEDEDEPDEPEDPEHDD